MAQFNIGPVQFRYFTGQNWSDLQIGFVTDRDGGMAKRETALRLGFKSEHLIDAVGVDNPADKFETPDGSVVFGKIISGPHGVHTLSAAEVYTRALFSDVKRHGLQVAKEQAVATAPVDATPDADVPADATPAEAAA